MRVVVAPDSFKGTATAAVIATAIADGWTSVRPHDSVVRVPMADGGEGTLDAFATAYPDAARIPVEVRGPDDRTVATSWLRLRDGRGVVELASTSGITLLDPLRPGTAHTIGFGQAVAAALDHGVDGLVLGIGGSASTDGGLGLLRALGLRTTSGAGATGSVALDTVGGVDRSHLRALPPRGVQVLGDVDSPLLGPTGAAAVFGPQKGLVEPGEVIAAEGRLARWAARFPDIDPASPGAGAAGGAGFGLLAWGAHITPGAPAVASALGLADAVADADLVITGEGRFDLQSAAGKVPATVRALAAGRPVALVAGAIEAATDGFAAAVSLRDLAAAERGDPGAALTDTVHFGREAGAALARSRA
ncbi:glycerate kinase [Curtobacterium sp. RRHDQ10]|uniref:glycerate kinase n=1 Tax=Curtobacterium phyllosphaerae TaxID=3413379 RepID=UPI003BF1A612